MIRGRGENAGGIIMRMLLSIGAAACLLLSETSSPARAQEVGKAVAIGDTVTGAQGKLVVQSPVHRDERIRTNLSGLGQFRFHDGTKLAVGPNAAVVIDKYVLGEGNQVQQLTVRATKGAFRWISGRSASAAYQIQTPVGSLSIRGTAVDFYVGSEGNTLAVLLNGRARFCLNNDRTNCRDLTRRCQHVLATRRDISQPSPITSETASQLAATNVTMPFLSGNRRLSRSLTLGGGSCGLTSRASAPSTDNETNVGRGHERERDSPGCEQCER
jgi:hypothetical protein